MDESVVLEENPNGEFTGSIQGKLVDGIGEDLQDTRPSISAQDALKIAVRRERDSIQNVRFDEAIDSKLQIYMKPGDDGDSSKLIPVLVYVLSYLVENDSKTSRPFYIINAKTGEVIKHWQGMDTRSKPSKQEIRGYGGNTKTGRYTYGVDYSLLKTTRVGVNACAYDFGKVKIIHLHGKEEGDKSFVVDCKKGAQDAANGAFSPANDALYFAHVLFDMYTKQYKVEPLKGARLIVQVHYGTNFENAFWDGKRMAFGDGGNSTFPMISVDVMGHEVSHGFTEKHSNLIYEGQSGGINEAFSDMAGEAAEEFSGRKVDWINGVEISKDISGNRWLNNPKLDNKSINHLECFYPDMDVHYSSGIFNKAFYLLTNNTPSWSIKKAFGVFVRANRLYWTENSTFAAAACGAINAARDMGFSTNDVEKAFQAVGVIPCVESPDIWQKLWTRIEDIQGQRSFVWTIPDGTRDLKLQVTGQADLYVKVGDVASADNYDHKASGENPTISAASPKAGVWYILVKGGSSVSHALRGNFDGPPSGAPLVKVESMSEDYEDEAGDADNEGEDDGGNDYPDEDEDYPENSNEDYPDDDEDQDQDYGDRSNSYAYYDYGLRRRSSGNGGGDTGGANDDEGSPNAEYHNVVIYKLGIPNVALNMMKIEVSPGATTQHPDTSYTVSAKPVNTSDEFGFHGSGRGYTMMKSCYLHPETYEIILKINGPYNAVDWNLKVTYITKILPVG